MTPREALDVLRRLDVAVAKAFSGAQFDASYAHPTIAGRGGWVVPILRWDALRLAASSARPALETLAGCVVVSRNTAHILLAAAKVAQSSGELAGVVDDEPFRAAITEAEEAMR